MKLRSITITIAIALAAAVAVSGAAGAQTPKPAETPKKPATGQSTPAPKKPAAGQPPATTARKPATPARGRAAAPTAAARAARLRNPARLKEVAPANYNVRFDTTAGPFVVQVHRAWAPLGADRFYNLVKNGFYDGAGFFRVMPNFMVQFGIHGTPSIQAAWRDANITDDPVTQSNKRGYITFATAGPNTRTTQVFINFKDNAGLDQDFAPFGEVTSGMEAVDKINPEYGERPNQGALQSQGNTYLKSRFPKLDYIVKATIERPTAATPPAAK